MRITFSFLFCFLLLNVGLSQSVNNTLPVELVYFEANVQALSVLLIFGTATEQENFGFDIERADTSRNWGKIGFVSKPPFNSNVPKDYDFEDTSITSNGTYYYRLKQLDLSGGFEYSWEDTVYVDFITAIPKHVMPSDFILYQNYPNPFNPVTNFVFRIPSASGGGLVTLKVYDAIGNEVKILLNEEKTPGEYKVFFDASDLASGVYLYRLTAGKLASAKTMILIK